MSRSSVGQNRKPSAIRIRHSALLAISVVLTAVFISRHSFEPNSRAMITELPMLQPKANAMKISVIS